MNFIAAPVAAWLLGSPYNAAQPGDAALRDAGFRYIFSDTKVERLP